ncbi:insulin-like growth factor-binding protein complex acid labile subunit isoform X2 [Drosophila bipectinata]|uniref:insulin-like growth factor-binding protein complex acid labile subunit isoform X2 n=1 Tax=Drosophila bipectinata TaxID=42026 RepID=UPI0038B3DD4B
MAANREQATTRTPATTPTSRSRSWLSEGIPGFCLLLSLFILLPLESRAFCPSKCQCLGGEANNRALCVDAALEDVPIQLNPETKYINLTLNRIRNLAYSLPFYVKLEILDLSQNIIETLGSKNFEYQSELRTLNLSRNLVSSLHKHAFKGLTNLLLLDLSFNRIETVHPTALSDLAALVELDLTNNNIVSLEDNCFKGMGTLEVLVFRNNRLLDVPATNLWHLHALKSLDMSDNLVEFVRNDSFEGLKELLALSLRGNVMSELDVSAFEGLISLKHLDLADNNLTMVPTQQLSKLSNLTYLNLGGNRFSQLPAVAFLNLFHLRELHLSRLDYLQHIDSSLRGQHPPADPAPEQQSPAQRHPHAPLPRQPQHPGGLHAKQQPADALLRPVPGGPAPEALPRRQSAPVQLLAPLALAAGDWKLRGSRPWPGARGRRSSGCSGQGGRLRLDGRRGAGGRRHRRGQHGRRGGCSGRLHSRSAHRECPAHHRAECI